MAIRFVTHAAEFASSVSFVLPRTVRKAPTQNRVARAFHLAREEPVPPSAFLHEGRPVDVPAVFQIWQRRRQPRPLIKVQTEHADREFTKPERADFVVQRVVAQAGRVHDDLGMSPSSHHFIRALCPGVRAVMERLGFASVSGDVARNPSLSKCDIVRLCRAATEVTR